MKKFILILLLGFQFVNAQDSIRKSAIWNKKNEVRFDVLSVIAFSKLNLTYERYLNKNFSLGLSANYTNSQKVNDDFDAGNRNTIPKYEITPFVRYNLSKGAASFYFVEVFAAANGGDYREIVRLIDVNNNAFYTIQKSNYSDLAIGAGIGYKFYIKEKFGVEFLVGFGSNMIDKDKSPNTLPRVGLSVGYRF